MKGDSEARPVREGERGGKARCHYPEASAPAGHVRGAGRTLPATPAVGSPLKDGVFQGRS